MVRSLEQITMRKVYLRILPFAALTYFFCYLDRINVGFAALTLRHVFEVDRAKLRRGRRRFGGGRRSPAGGRRGWCRSRGPAIVVVAVVVAARRENQCDHQPNDRDG